MLKWIQAARLRTLPLSISGIIVGSFIAKWRLEERMEQWDPLLFVLALVLTLLFQVLSNYANDLGDAQKGTDLNRSTSAEKRTVASGAISQNQMTQAVILLSVLSFLFTVLLLYFAFLKDGLWEEFWIFLALGVLCILAAIGYTVGKKPYGYLGLGDIMVFLFFGLLAVGGSYFLFTKTWEWDLLLPGSAIGMLAAGVLNLNNMRDLPNDIKTNKRTFAQYLGYKGAMIYQMIILQLPILLILVFLMVNKLHEKGQYYAFIVMVMLFPMAALRRRILQTKSPEELDPFLKQLGIQTLTTSVLLALGLTLFN